MRIKISIKPNSSKNEILEQEGDTYKIAVKAAPIEGKANQELIKFLSKHFKKKAKIISGKTSKHKIIELE